MNKIVDEESEVSVIMTTKGSYIESSTQGECIDEKLRRKIK